MSENWLQRTVGIGEVVDRLRAAYTDEGINEITSGNEYKDAQAAIALALNEALDKTNLTDRKKRRMGKEMLDTLMGGVAVVFMLGYDCAQKRDDGGAQ